MLNMNKIFGGMAAVALCLTACNPEPDESSRFTETQETIGSMIDADSSLTAFNYILKRSGMDRMMKSYGQYTCFAPSNQAVMEYIDSLYKDPTMANHNGMESNSLEGMSDSLCEDIAPYHIASTLQPLSDPGGSGKTITTMLRRAMNSSVDDEGLILLNSQSRILGSNDVTGEVEASNGILYRLDKVVPRNNSKVYDVFADLEGYSIFAEALRRTGLSDSISAVQKTDEFGQPIVYELADCIDRSPGANNAECYWPKTCDVKFTVFAESDAVMAKAGINSFDDLVEYCKRIYGNATQWYDYAAETGQKISTADDYTNRFNVVNMFVAYHILYCGMPYNQLVFLKPGSGNRNPPDDLLWNYTNGGEPYDYYETMLPHTLMKIWNPRNTRGSRIYINRYVANNTLTNRTRSMGTDDMHPVIFEGVEVENPDESIKDKSATRNGYIIPVKSMLVYDQQVPQGVLKERLRFDSSTFLPELVNNEFRYLSVNAARGLNGGGHGDRIAFPLNFFDNVVCYSTETVLRYNVKGWYRAYQADAFQGWGNYDLAIRIPPVPTGDYELRLFYTPMDHAGMMQFYMGKTSAKNSMRALGIPLDARIQADNPLIGWTKFYEEDDDGVASDQAMRNRGYMRGPYMFFGGKNVTSGDAEGVNCRGEAPSNTTLRLLLGTDHYLQSEDHWFRIKSVIDDKDLKWQLDFIELVPTSVVNNEQYSEDWY